MVLHGTFFIKNLQFRVQASTCAKINCPIVVVSREVIGFLLQSQNYNYLRGITMAEVAIARAGKVVNCDPK